MTTKNKYIDFKWIFVLFLMVLSQPLVYAQISQDKLVKFTPEFTFNSGFYINFDQVKANDPIPPARIITTYDYTSNDFFNKILDEKKLAFFDKQGVRQEVNINKLWGFSRNGVVFIRVGEVFNRITYMGSICHFVATITSYNTRYYDPYYYNPYSPYRSMYSPSNYTSSEMRQFIMDFESGEVLDYDENNTALLLMKDAELHDEFMSLKRKKRKQLKFMYMRKFNERNPLYLPQ
jgi:hypothetical protein